MAAKPLPSQEVLRQLLDYVPETGKLYWKERGVEWFVDTADRTAVHSMNRWNACYSGKEALASRSKTGHLNGKVLGANFLTHRVIWMLVYGRNPDGIDHINGNPADNHIANLRSCGQAENTKNSRLRIDNRSGIHGLRKRGNSWVASIGINGTTMHILQSVRFCEALKSRKAAEREYGFHPNHGRAA